MRIIHARRVFAGAVACRVDLPVHLVAVAQWLVGMSRRVPGQRALFCSWSTSVWVRRFKAGLRTQEVGLQLPCTGNAK